MSTLMFDSSVISVSMKTDDRHPTQGVSILFDILHSPNRSQRLQFDDHTENRKTIMFQHYLDIKQLILADATPS